MPHQIELIASTRKKTKESVRVDSLVPSELRIKAEKLISLLEDYYTHINESGQASFEINSIREARDIDAAASKYVDLLQKEIATVIPKSLLADRITLYKNLVRYYNIRGSEESIELFFKILFQDNAEVYFPRKDMLIASDGVWLGNLQIPKYAESPILKIYGNGTGASARLTVSGGAITAVQVVNPGSGYTATATAEVFGTGTGAVVRPVITRIGANAGKIESYEILSGGTGFTQPGTFLGYQLGTYNEKRGFLSDVVKLQDSYFYQKFSYVVRTGNNVDEWKDIFAKLVHPAGTLFFGEILVLLEIINSEAAMPTEQLGYIGPEDLAIILILQALREYSITVASGSGAFSVGELVSVVTTGAIATVKSFVGNVLTVNLASGNFSPSSGPLTIVGQTSGCSRSIVSAELVPPNYWSLTCEVAEAAHKLLMSVPTGTDTSYQLKFFDANSAIGVYGSYNFDEMLTEYAWDDHSIAGVINSTVTWNGLTLGVNYT